MENEVSAQDLIYLSFDQKPVEFQQAFDTLMTDRIAKAIEDKKLEVAQSMYYNIPDDTNDDDDDNAAVEDELDREPQEDNSDGESA
jgi:hypothetical protein